MYKYKYIYRAFSLLRFILIWLHFFILATFITQRKCDFRIGNIKTGMEMDTTCISKTHMKLITLNLHFKNLIFKT